MIKSQMSNTSKHIHVIKRTGEKKLFNISKIESRLKSLCQLQPPLNTEIIDVTNLTIKVLGSIYNNIKTSELDMVAAKICANIIEPQYEKLAARLIIDNLRKNTKYNVDVRTLAGKLYRHFNPKNGIHHPLISKQLYTVYNKYADKINNILVWERDFLIDYFGITTFQKSYLLQCMVLSSTNEINFKPTERIQHLWIRIAISCFISKDFSKQDKIDESTWKKIKEFYDDLSLKRGIVASPILFNSGTPGNTLISCYLYRLEDDSTHIMDSCKYAGLLSKGSGGLGINFSCLRSNGSPICGNMGISSGTTKFIQIMESTLGAFDQAGKRPGAATISLDIWHADFETFIDLRLQEGDASLRARKLNYALMLNDLFIERVKKDEKWSFMNPQDCHDLPLLWGDKFKERYQEYETQGMFVKQVRAQQILKRICYTIQKVGMPFLLNKDAMNRKSNQQGWAVITNSNLCCEIALPCGKLEVIQHSNNKERYKNYYLKNLEKYQHQEYIFKETTSIFKDTFDEINKSDEVANCNLASISIPAFIETDEKTQERSINYRELANLAKRMVERLDNFIDRHKYVLPQSERANMLHRPIGIGVQGFANTLQKLHIPWESPEANDINELVFESIWYGAMIGSVMVAKKKGCYPTFYKSPASIGILQPDMWNIEKKIKEGSLPDRDVFYLKTYHTENLPQPYKSKLFDIDTLRNMIEEFGLRNSEVIAPMPTAGTSQLLGNYESFDPAMSNAFKRDTMNGSFIVRNNDLIHLLKKNKYWCEDLSRLITSQSGSIQHIQGLPDSIKNIFKTAHEVSQKSILNMAFNRGKFITQTQSMNLYFETFEDDHDDNKKEPFVDRLSSAIVYASNLGLKTLCYYVRTKPATQPQNFVITEDMLQRAKKFIVDVNKNGVGNIQENGNWTQKFEDTICLPCGS